MKRTLPWLLAIVAYIAPPVWAWVAIERDASAQRAAHGWVCGNPALGIVVLACIGAGSLSLAATVARGWLRRWWSEVSRTAMAFELVALLLPLGLATTFVGWIWTAC